ncbi:RHS repeat-associated core domain-containing protein [Parapedobacter composti]|uniref:RHS repeat-associated core domain-containing protein n=1 Tax=Parapedobacter composti TaxID=623281 RepID=A0A1I1M0I5_9SPHI|nr:RHS repeat-associated core domain-containing protein [Parapedobacter composti]SFC78889.1 RHS repeat-associated core domain-containing protein [Parapedobacter composti]
MNFEYHAGDYKKAGTGIGSIQHASYPAQYSGNLSGLSWQSRKPSSITGLDAPVMNAFRYDHKYQLQHSGWGTPNYSNGTYTEQTNLYREYGLSYDGNGNIQTLKRTNGGGATTADYTYGYVAGTNKLASVPGYATYTYDAIGRLSSEVKGSSGMYLEYDVSGKVTKIYSNSAKTNLIISFVYDEAGQRIKKQDHRNGSLTWYVYDAGGTLMGVYDNHGGSMALKEQPVYGAGRLGIYFRQGNSYQYALTDHLGSVRAVINRNKLSNGNADVVYYADYYPFGMVLRSGGTGWRYGYQGEYSEKDGETGWNAFELRNYDAAIGRWLSIDPYGQYWSPYVGMGNDPVNGIDPDGGERTDWYLPLGARSTSEAVWFDGFGARAGYAWLGGADYIFGSQTMAEIRASSGLGRMEMAFMDELFIAMDAYRRGTGALFMGYPDNLLDKAFTSFYDLNYRYNEIDPFSRLPIMGNGALVDANWIIDLGAGGLAGGLKALAGGAARGAPKYLYHYTSREAAQSISQSGLRVGRDGFSYLTNNSTLRPLQAQIELALPANRALPNSLLRINTSGLTPAAIRRVQGNLPGLGAGGGMEFLFNQHIPASAIKIIR